MTSSTCDDIELNNSEMDSFSIQNFRRDSNHCFYQNRGMIGDQDQDKVKINQIMNFFPRQSFNLYSQVIDNYYDIYS